MTLLAIGAPPAWLPAVRRRHRLFGDGEDLAVFLCADVGLQIGPPGRTRRLGELRALAQLPIDGIFLSQAAVPTFSDILAERPELKLVIRLDWCNEWRGADLSPVIDSAGVTVSTAKEAAESGADAVVHYALLGHSDPRIEADYIARAAAAVRDAHRVGLPCILEPLIRGGNSAGFERAANHLAWGIRTAEELGADAVKVEFPYQEDVETVLASASVPVLIASTPPISDSEALSRAQLGHQAGATGIAYSADFFAARDPHGLVADLRTLGNHTH